MVPPARYWLIDQGKAQINAAGRGGRKKMGMSSKFGDQPRHKLFIVS